MKSARHLRSLVLTALIGLGTSGCDKPKPLGFMLHFSAMADEKHPVPGVQINARGKPLGVTDAAGELKSGVRGMEGQRLAIEVQCPDGYATEADKDVVILRSIRGLAGEERRPISHALVCQPVKRDAVVLVHATGDVAELPVKIDGQVVGKTDGLGFAHFHLRSDPGSRFEVALDTSSNEAIMPKNPMQAFQVDARDELFLFEKSFKLPPEPKAKARQRRRVKLAPKVHRPVRLQ